MKLSTEKGYFHKYDKKIHDNRIRLFSNKDPVATRPDTWLPKSLAGGRGSDKKG